MANTTPIVTTVTKTATKEKTPNGEEAASRVNILDFCHRRQSAFERLSDTYSPSTTKSGPNRDTLEMVPTIEVVLTNGTLLLTETVLEAETALTASKNRM
nr:hypothetical protein [Tanacetum cinerariifolium]